jgi:hypothetical protein
MYSTVRPFGDGGDQVDVDLGDEVAHDGQVEGLGQAHIAEAEPRNSKRPFGPPTRTPLPLGHEPGSRPRRPPSSAPGGAAAAK